MKRLRILSNIQESIPGPATFEREITNQMLRAACCMQWLVLVPQSFPSPSPASSESEDSGGSYEEFVEEEGEQEVILVAKTPDVSN